MNEAADHFPGMLVSADESLEREFEEAVRTSADLAVRVAFSILRRREDAEEIAQEAYARAYRRFRIYGSPSSSAPGSSGSRGGWQSIAGGPSTAAGGPRAGRQRERPGPGMPRMKRCARALGAALESDRGPARQAAVRL